MPCVNELQVRQDHYNTKSNSEIFGRRRDEKTVSGFLVDPTKQSREVKDMRKVSGDDLNRNASLSGPLVHGPRRTRPVRERSNDPPMVSSRANLSKLSDLVAARFSACENQQEKPGPSQPETMFDAGRFNGSTNHEAEPTRTQDRKHRPFKIGHSRPADDEKACAKDSSLVSSFIHHRNFYDFMSHMKYLSFQSSILGILLDLAKHCISQCFFLQYGHNSKANKIYVSGPLLVSSNSVDQMLKDHDRRIQEFARRTRLDKARAGMANSTSGPRHVAG